MWNPPWKIPDADEFKLEKTLSRDRYKLTVWNMGPSQGYMVQVQYRQPLIERWGSYRRGYKKTRDEAIRWAEEFLASV